MREMSLLCFLLMLSIQQFGQRSLQITRTSQEILIDGVLDEDVWQQADKMDDFMQYFPTDSVAARGQSEIQMTYDDDFLYISVKCYSKGNDWVVNSLKRDYRGGGIDNMTITFDSFKDKTNAYFFGINAEGVIREGVITNGGNSFRDFDESWDNKWSGEAKKYDGYFAGELKIPFSSLRFNAGSKIWNIGAYRYDAQENEWSTWTGIPRNYPMTNLGFNGQLIWDEPLKSSGSKVSIIPYVTAGLSRDHEANTDSEYTYDVGGDAKIALTSGLNLDLTINPDFSQVEVDRQITDLSRFEIFFPERRQFFLENADLFGSFGFSAINPFFSRRIGTAKNNEDNTVQNRIYAGARLSGKLNDNMRLGLLNMQTAADKTDGVYATNYSVLAVQHKVMNRSNISFLMVNKQLLDTELDDLDIALYNRVIGADFNFADASNTWTGKTFVHGSLSPGIDGMPITHGTELNYNSRFWEFGWTHEYVQSDYDAQVGFVRRSNYYSFEPGFARKFYPSDGALNDFGIGLDSEFIFKPGFGKTDHSIGLTFGGTTSNNSRFEFRVAQEYVYLFDDFDPTGTDSQPLLVDTDYSYINFEGFFSGDRRKPVAFFIRPFVGQYFNGWRYGSGGRITLTAKPKAQLAIDFNYNIFDMPHLEDKKKTFLLGPRIDYTFSKELFFTTFIQYNTQSENTNINARLQWRFAPVSDFFLVFTDNYFTGADPSDRFNINLRNRAIVAKLTYWFNT